MPSIHGSVAKLVKHPAHNRKIFRGFEHHPNHQQVTLYNAPPFNICCIVFLYFVHGLYWFIFHPHSVVQCNFHMPC